jgi:DNA-binding NtrC family response regulator
MNDKYENQKILFVDDDEYILASLKRALKCEKFEKYFAKCGEEALGIMAQNDIAVIITDLNMPGMGGIELLYSVKMIYPDTVRVILSAHSEVQVILDAIHTGETHRYLLKPWDTEKTLVPLIHQSLQLHALMREKKDSIDRITKLNARLENDKEEISFLQKAIEKSNSRDKKLLAFLKNEIEKFIADVLRIADELINENDGSVKKKAGYLKDIGLKTKEALKDIKIITAISMEKGE